MTKPFREPERVKRIAQKVELLWHRFPDLRYVQLIYYICCGKDPEFPLEDTEFEQLLDNRLRSTGSRTL